MYDLKKDIKELETQELKKFSRAFIENPTLLILHYLSDNNIEVNIENEESRKFYKSFIKGNIPGSHGFMKKYPIASYNGTKHYDDQSFKEDLLTKPLFRDLYNFLEDKKIENISVLLHIINEMDRNIRNHSGYIDRDKKEYYFAIQYYKKSNEIIFSFLDDGVGIKQNLASYHQKAIYDKQIPSNTTIGTFACINGVTSKSNHSEVEGPGRNSGYGLFMLKELGSFNDNSMKIVADNKVYKVKHKTKSKTLQSEVPLKNECLQKITFVTAKLSLNELDVQLAQIESNAKSISGKSRVIPLTNGEIHELFKSLNDNE